MYSLRSDNVIRVMAGLYHAPLGLPMVVRARVCVAAGIQAPKRKGQQNFKNIFKICRLFMCTCMTSGTDCSHKMSALVGSLGQMSSMSLLLFSRICLQQLHVQGYKGYLIFSPGGSSMCQTSIVCQYRCLAVLLSMSQVSVTS